MSDEKLEKPIKLPSSSWFVALIGLALVVLGLASSIAKTSPGPILTAPRQEAAAVPLATAQATSSTVKINNLEVEVTLATDPIAHARGLSGRPALGPLEGMLFVFAKDTQPGFWMKEMNFPLDLIWIESDGRIAEITKNVTPDTYPQIFIPKEPIRYVLEVNAGFADQHFVQVGDIIHLNQ